LENSSLEKIYQEKVGQGPHLSFLHGFCESLRLWDPIIEQLREKYTCWSLDLPGFGRSAACMIPEISRQAAFFCDILRKQGTKETILIAHSMGGYIGLEMLNQDPELIRGLALIHSTARKDSPANSELREKSIDFLRSNTAESFLKPFSKRLVSEQHYPELESKLWQLISQTSKTSIIDAQKQMMNRSDHLHTLKASDSPILFICGDSDDFFKAEDLFYQASICQTRMLSLI
jgi:pimeloyl-ACP methyl ester carboxylesterase